VRQQDLAQVARAREAEHLRDDAVVGRQRRTPTAVLMSVGQRLVTKIVNSVDDETPPMFLNATSASGNHTSGETGRSTCTIGSNSFGSWDSRR
jgi:hypothetical protein